MRFDFKKPLSIKHKDFPESVLSTKVVDLLCDRVHGLGKKEQKLINAYKKPGFKDCKLSDYEVNAFKELKGITAENIERDLGTKPVVVTMIKYKGSRRVHIWCDSSYIHRLIAYVMVYGEGVTLRDIPIIVVDLSNEEEITVYGKDKCIMLNFTNIGVLVDKAYALFESTNSNKVLSINYTVGDFIFTNKELWE